MFDQDARQAWQTIFRTQGATFSSDELTKMCQDLTDFRNSRNIKIRIEFPYPRYNLSGYPLMHIEFNWDTSQQLPMLEIILTMLRRTLVGKQNYSRASKIRLNAFDIWADLTPRLDLVPSLEHKFIQVTLAAGAMFPGAGDWLEE